MGVFFSSLFAFVLYILLPFVIFVLLKDLKLLNNYKTVKYTNGKNIFLPFVYITFYNRHLCLNKIILN